MTKTTAKNDVRKIQTVLENYIGKRKSAKVAAEISVVMKTETQHTHNCETFFVHKDADGALVISKESTVSKQIESILKSYLEEDEVQECMGLLRLDQTLIETNTSKESSKFETLHIEGSDSEIYTRILRHKPVPYYEGWFDNRPYFNKAEESFQEKVRWIIEDSVTPDFEVFVCDPSIDENGKLQFLPGFKPAVGYSYNELKKLAEENDLRLGTKKEYILYIATLLLNLIDEGWPESDAWYAVCGNSSLLGHFKNSINAKNELELTGSRKFGGKCDIGNTSKILDNKLITLPCFDFEIEALSKSCVLGYIDEICDVEYADDPLNAPFNDSVGWFVR